MQSFWESLPPRGRRLPMKGRELGAEGILGTSGRSV